MAKRHNHYELAFEEYLRHWRVPYVAVDETKRSLAAKGSLKSLDYLVSPPGRPTWLVDVKGRQFPAGRRGQYWRNWSTRDDIVSLQKWEKHFAGPCVGLFVFAYHVIGRLAPVPEERLFPFRGRLYAFLAVRLADFAASARAISPKWGTVAMPAGAFRQRATPAEQLFLSREIILRA